MSPTNLLSKNDLVVCLRPGDWQLTPGKVYTVVRAHILRGDATTPPDENHYVRIIDDNFNLITVRQSRFHHIGRMPFFPVKDGNFDKDIDSATRATIDSCLEDICHNVAAAYAHD